MIRSANINDAADIAEIYNHNILYSTSTFEEEIVTQEEMQSRIEITQETHPWLVYIDEEKVQGYAYAKQLKDRSAYKFSVEISVYVHHEHGGKGIAFSLYQELMSKLKKQGIHAVIAGITLPNEASIRLHEKLGMEKIAHYKEVGFKFDQWLDVGYWEMIL